MCISQYIVSLLTALICLPHSRMMAIAPNLTTMVGELVGARLIAHAGSLLNLAKHPSSTVQILGAEKALFRCVCVCVTCVGMCGVGGHLASTTALDVLCIQKCTVNAWV